VFLLPPPVEAMREFMVLLEAAGFTEAEIRMMNTANPAKLFRVEGAA
jgi:predicted metal-dependent phosphotriesterase family hydrolase